ncbi:MAG: helix-turn-helix transcriptional regulator [Oscillibacter sp.]|nr:helix-turn-helix transcriptional regulator [Oscillibacter sp.]
MAKRNVELMQAIGKRIATRRLELKMTQEQAADFIGLSRPFYACIERGEKGVGADSLLKICTAFQISADYLLTGSMQPAERQYMNKLVSQLNEEQRKAALTIMESLLQACGCDLPEK